MINLLPPAIKEEVSYSQRNATLLMYVKIAVATTMVLAGALFGGRWYLDQQVKRTEESIANKQLQLDHRKDLESEAKSLNARLTSIKTIQKSQSKFSVLLADLAQYMPHGTAISSLTLTGDDKKPVRLVVDSTEYKTALSFRDSISKSARISAADIEDIKATNDALTNRTTYKVTMTFTFNPGKAK